MNSRKRLESYIASSFTAFGRDMIGQMLDDYRKEILKDVYKKLQEEGGASMYYGEPTCDCASLVNPDWNW